MLQGFRISFWVGLFFCCACQKKVLYKHRVDFVNESWAVEDLPTFHWSVEDTTKAYAIFLHISATVAYPFQNCYVSYRLEAPSGIQISTALKNFQLFDLKTGKPLVEGFFGEKSYEWDVLRNYYFPHRGTYTLKLEQFMRKDDLPGILSVGVKVVKEDENL